MATKKDYEAVAAGIAEARDGEVPEVDIALDALAEDLALYFEEDNPRFSRERFLRAAGVE
jgi:carbamoylphosphate synthase large subunit